MPHSSDPVTYEEMRVAAARLRAAAVRDLARATLERVADMLDGQLPGPVETAVHDALHTPGLYEDVDGDGDSASILADYVSRLAHRWRRVGVVAVPRAANDRGDIVVAPESLAGPPLPHGAPVYVDEYQA